MAQIIRSFSQVAVVDVISDHFDMESKEQKYYPADLLDELEEIFGRLPSEEDIEAAIDLWVSVPLDDEERFQREAVGAQEEAYFNSYHKLCTAD